MFVVCMGVCRGFGVGRCMGVVGFDGIGVFRGRGRRSGEKCNTGSLEKALILQLGSLQPLATSNPRHTKSGKLQITISKMCTEFTFKVLI